MKTTLRNDSSRHSNTIWNVFIIITLIIIIVFCFNKISSAQDAVQYDQTNTVLSSDNSNVTSQLFNGFESIAKEGKVYLKWYVKDKYNGKIYFIERSGDGFSYQTAGVVKSNAGKYDVIILNCYTDNEAVAGYSYYRIVASDEFGSKEYSATNMVYNDVPSLNTNTVIYSYSNESDRSKSIFVNNTLVNTSK